MGLIKKCHPVLKPILQIMQQHSCVSFNAAIENFMKSNPDDETKVFVFQRIIETQTHEGKVQKTQTKDLDHVSMFQIMESHGFKIEDAGTIQILGIVDLILHQLILSSKPKTIKYRSQVLDVVLGKLIVNRFGTSPSSFCCL